MKSLHLTNAYHPTSGGIREFYHALLRRAASAGHQMRLVVPWAETKVDDLDSHSRIYHVRAPQSRFFDTRYRTLFPPRVLGPRSDVLEILRAEQPDLIEVCDKYSLFYLAGAIRKGWIRMNRRPVLVGLSCERMDDNVASYLGLGALGRTLSALYMRRIYLPQFDCHLANSHYTAGELTRQARKHPRAVRVLPMGVDIARFGLHRRSAEVRRQLLARVGATESSRLLIYAGRLASEKNVGLLPRVIGELSYGRHDYRLLIAGTGPLSDSLTLECSRRAPGRTTFLRHLDRDALADLLANADAFLHPNPREPFGIAPLEAMASGLPLVAPAHGGVTTYASDETAWLASANAESFAGRVQEIFADDAARDRKTARAMAVAKDYAWERVAGQFFQTYEQLVRTSTGSPFTDS
ncbi:MAG TPA: glycosyltransferase [Vicinamibacterales bacterium]|nr:glycosyltransferase [Vicinamibacterales bacterium]